MYDLLTRSQLAAELAAAFVGGRWRAEDLAERGAGALDRRPDWMSALAMRAAAAYRTPPAARELATLIDSFLAERPAAVGDREPPQIIRLVAERPSERAALEHGWSVARIETTSELADRLELSDGQLAWLADVRGLERTVAAEKLRNYRYRALTRPSGVARVIEAPKARLKEIQRWVLREILDHVPGHAAAHGFTAGRSVISHAGLHTGQETVLRLDVRDFFAAVAAGRVYGIFRTIGYPAAVAHALTGLTTNALPVTVCSALPRPADPRRVGAHFWLGRQLATPHLPQGAPTSPALANLAAFRLDRRLAGLAAARGLRYSRYADDLTFSGPRRLARAWVQTERGVAAIAAEEGFALNPAKVVLRTAASRQTVCGVVVNAHPNVARAEYDRLKAILHNAARHGPAGQNRAGVADFEAHLRGRVAWVASVHPGHGERLRRRLAEIDWTPAG